MTATSMRASARLEEGRRPSAQQQDRAARHRGHDDEVDEGDADIGLEGAEGDAFDLAGLEGELADRDDGGERGVLDELREDAGERGRDDAERLRVDDLDEGLLPRKPQSLRRCG